MSSLLQATPSWEDLLRVSDPRLPYRFERIFSGEGFFARRLARQRFKLLRRLDGALQRMLETGEKVEYVSWGIEYSFVEAYFLGLWHYVLNRRALVLTDRRILLLQIGARKTLLDLKSHVRYEAIQGFVKGTFGMLGLQLRNGQKLYLTGVPRRDRKAIRAHVEERMRSTEIAQRAAGASGRQNLCPHCYSTVTGFPDRCRRCAGAFKSASRAGWLSLLFPGLGDLYLGHRALGFVEIVGALVMWAILLPAFAAVAAERGRDVTTLTAFGAVCAVVFLLTHGVDAWITRRTGRKGLYPARS